MQHFVIFFNCKADNTGLENKLEKSHSYKQKNNTATEAVSITLTYFTVLKNAAAEPAVKLKTAGISVSKYMKTLQTIKNIALFCLTLSTLLQLGFERNGVLCFSRTFSA
jgi:hypothetical protein